MRKKRKLTVAAGAVVLLALVAVLLWCFVPRPMMKGELYRVTCWNGQDDVELIDQVDKEAVQDVLEGFHRNYGGRESGYLLEKYPLELGFDYVGGSWYVVAGPDGAFVYDSGEDSLWRVLGGKKLWQELAPLIPAV